MKFFSGCSCPHLTHSGVCVCRRSGGISFYTDVYPTALSLPGTSSRKAFMLQGMPLFCQTDQQCWANVPAEVCDTWKAWSLTPQCQYSPGPTLRPCFSTSISCSPKLLVEQCVFSFLSYECDTSAQGHHSKKLKGRISAPFRDKNVALTD